MAKKPTIDQWKALSAKQLKGRSLEELTWQTAEGIKVKPSAQQLNFEDTLDPETYGEDDEALLADELDAVATASAELPTPTEEARGLLSKMRALADRARRRPDAKALALFAWLKTNCCPGIGDPKATKKACAWTNRRVILYTEYADTKRYLLELLTEAIRHTDGGEERFQFPPDSAMRGYQATQQHFVDCLRSGAEPETSGPETLKTMELVFGAYDSAAHDRVYRVGHDLERLESAFLRALGKIFSKSGLLLMYPEVTNLGFFPKI